MIVFRIALKIPSSHPSYRNHLLPVPRFALSGEPEGTRTGYERKTDSLISVQPIISGHDQGVRGIPFPLKGATPPHFGPGGYPVFPLTGTSGAPDTPPRADATTQPGRRHPAAPAMERP